MLSHRVCSRLAPAATVLLLMVLMPAAALASWPDDPTVNVALSLAPGAKSDVFVIPDGQGGAIVAWEDDRAGQLDIYVQRVSAAGEVLWQADGVPVCTAPGDQDLDNSSTGTTGITPLVSDGQGGAWIVWQDERAFGQRLRDIHAQRVDADGNVLLAADGVAVADGAGMEDGPTACSDGQGGLIVAWQDKNADPIFFDIHAQRLDPAGRPQWNGGASVPVCTVDWDQDGPSIAADGSGGAVIAWSDSRVDVGDVYAQRLDAAGSTLWSANGVPVATASGGQDAIVAVAAGAGETLLAWVDRRGSGPDIYAQKLDAAGASLWTPGGLGVCIGLDSQYRPALAPDGTGGAYVAWFDYRNASGPPWNLDIYAQRLDADGAAAWTTSGIAVCAAPDAQRDVAVCADGDGGLFLAWEDNRVGTGREDVYAQWLQPDGSVRWQADGVAVSTAPGNQESPAVVAGAGGVIVAWPDDRDVLYEADVYCDRVLAGDPTAAPQPRPGSLDLVVGNRPEEGLTTFALALPHDAIVRAEIVDLRGRRVHVLESGVTRTAGNHELVWRHRDRSGRPVAAGVYLVRVQAGGRLAVGRVVVVR
jgi:hypothetical protein